MNNQDPPFIDPPFIDDPPFDGLFEYAYELLREGLCYGIVKLSPTQAALLVPLDAKDDDYFKEYNWITIVLKRISPPQAEEV